LNEHEQAGTMQDPADNHPSPDRLRAFDQGRLGPTEWAAVERHLLNCAACGEQLQVLPDQRLVDLLGEYDPERLCAATPAGLTTPPGPVAPPATAEPDVPRELVEHPRYRLHGWLASGGMGMVFKAEHRLMRRPVALKVIHPYLLNRPAAVERFHREVRAAACLAHPNIVTALDAEQAGAVHFLVMEYVEGETLDRVVDRRGPLPVAEACAYLRQASLGLHHAHERGMVHRDLKPSNLIVTAAGQVKILDFGLAQFAQEGLAGPGLTPEGVVVGTPGYLAPEQARDPGTADVRADLYSLGCTLYHLLAGRPPFLGGGPLQQLLAHQDRTPRPLAEFRGDLPDALVRIVDRLLAKDPADRFPSPAQLAEALAPFITGETPGRAPTRAGSGRRFLAWTLGLALLVLVGGGLLTWHLATARNPTRQEPSPSGVLPTPPEEKAAAAWSDRPSARVQAVAWLRENNDTGPDHPVVADLAGLMDRDVKDGRAFLIRLGPALVRSGKPTQLAGRHHDLYAFTFTPEQAADWVSAKASDFCVSTAPRQEINSHPLVRLSMPQIDRADALDPVADITGTVAYQKQGDVSGTLTLRLTCITKRGTRTLFEAMPELKLEGEGRIPFNLGSLYDPKESEPIPRGPVIFFLELGRWPAPGSAAQMVLISNMVAAPVYFRPPAQPSPPPP
jgi:predicted Ser/Thr protein kinase